LGYGILLSRLGVFMGMVKHSELYSSH